MHVHLQQRHQKEKKKKKRGSERSIVCQRFTYFAIPKPKGTRCIRIKEEINEWKRRAVRTREGNRNNIVVTGRSSPNISESSGNGRAAADVCVRVWVRVYVCGCACLVPPHLFHLSLHHSLCITWQRRDACPPRLASSCSGSVAGPAPTGRAPWSRASSSWPWPGHH